MPDVAVNGEATGFATRKRGYSREFPVSVNGKRYLLSDIPLELWSSVRAKAKRDGISVRTLILRLLSAWLRDEGTQPVRVNAGMNDLPFDRPEQSEVIQGDHS